MNCSRCNSSRFVRHGKNYSSNTSRYRCKDCRRFHTPNPKPHGYPPALRQQALALAIDGHSNRSIAWTRGIAHQTTANWVKAAGNAAKAQGLPLPASEACGDIAELDELHTFAGQKKPALPCDQC
ncbi:MAG: hypothetical protein NZL91_08270 [Thermoflexales bacterium]|nr:hypothetical protein [Thermoflexales bacterium]MDW8293535.1 hypothetical protein [Anaerolineae bacterium]